MASPVIARFDCRSDKMRRFPPQEQVDPRHCPARLDAKGKKFVVDRTEAETIRIIFRSYLEPQSFSQPRPQGYQAAHRQDRQI
jgi:hypothetical protein